MILSKSNGCETGGIFSRPFIISLSYMFCNSFHTCRPSSFIASGVSFTNVKNKNVINSLFVYFHSSTVMFGFCCNFICKSCCVNSCPCGVFNAFLSASVKTSTNSLKFCANIFFSSFLSGGVFAPPVTYLLRPDYRTHTVYAPRVNCFAPVNHGYSVSLLFAVFLYNNGLCCALYNLNAENAVMIANAYCLICFADFKSLDFIFCRLCRCRCVLMCFSDCCFY